MIRIWGARKRKAGRLHAQPSEAVRMEQKRFGFFPDVFTWRGRRYSVHSVERVWETSARRPFLAPVEKHCFRVRCTEGVFELRQDVRSGAWTVAKFEVGNV